MSEPPLIHNSSARRTEYESILIGFLLLVACVLRICNLNTLPPFIDETAALNLGADPRSFTELSRLMNGKYLGYLLFKPLYLLFYDPLYAARLLMASIGVAVVAVITAIAFKLGGRIAAVAACAIAALSPFFVFNDRIALCDQLGMLLASAAILLAVMAGSKGRAFTFWSAFLFALACSTKVYFAVLAPLLFLTPEPRPGYFKALLPKAAFMAAGFIAAIAILTLLMANSLGDLHAALRMPGGLRGLATQHSGFVSLPEGASTTRFQLFCRNIAFVAGVIQTYQGKSFIALFVLCALALAKGQKPASGIILLVTIALSAVAMSAVLVILLPRYLGVLMFPAVVAIGLGAGAVFARLPASTGEPWIRVWGREPLRALHAVALALVGMIAAAAMSKGSVLIMVNQFKYRQIPAVDRLQYQTGWGSGIHLREMTQFIRDYCMSAGRPVVLWTIGGMSHGDATFPLLLRGATGLQFIHDWTIRPDSVRKLLASNTDVLVLIEPQAQFLNYADLAKGGLSIDTIYSTPKVADGGEYMIQRIQEAPQPAPPAQ